MMEEIREEVRQVFDINQPHELCKGVYLSYSAFPKEVDRYEFPVFGKFYENVDWKCFNQDSVCYWKHSQLVMKGESSVILTLSSDFQSINKILFKWKPRIITMEQAFGMEFEQVPNTGWTGFSVPA